MRLAILILAIAQAHILLRSDFQACYNDESADGLELEARWMWILLSVQVIMTIFFGLWRMTLMSLGSIIHELRR